MGYKEAITLVLSTSFVVSCGGPRVIANQVEVSPTLTITPNPNMLVTEEPEDNSYLGTPGTIETQIVSTAIANFDNPEKKELVSQKAVDSLVSISLWSDAGLVGASGNLAYLSGYPVILTSGHIHDYFDVQGVAIQKLSVNRLNISNPITLSFLNYKEAHIHNDGGDHKDIGVFVITDPSEIMNLTQSVSIDHMLKIEDLRFEPVIQGEPVSGICYPGTSYPYPYPFSGIVYGDWKSQVIIDDALTAPRCSGGGLFDLNGRYFASVSAGYSFVQFKDVDQRKWDDTFVFPLSSIGRDGLELLINQAISK